MEEKEEINKNEIMVEKDLKKILTSIFIQNRDKNNEYLIIKDATLIPDLLSYLDDDNINSSSKSELVHILLDTFKLINHNMEIISNYTDKKSNLSLFKILIKYYLLSSQTEESEENKFLNDILELLKLLLSHISCPVDVYKYVNDYLKNYMGLLNDNPLPEHIINSKLTKDKFNKFIKILQILYGDENQNIIPSNYFYFSGGDGISINNINNTLNFDKGSIDIFLSLKMNLDAKTVQSFISENKISLITLKLFSLFNISLDIDNENQLDINNKKLGKIPINKWFNLYIKIKKIKTLMHFDIYLNNEKQEVDIEYDQHIITEINFFKNFIGECSSIIILSDQNEDKIKSFISLYENFSFKYDLFTEETYSMLLRIKRENIQRNYKIMESETTILNSDNDYEQGELDEKKILCEIFENILHIYLPTRYELTESSNIILKESFNKLDGIINKKNNLNGIHLFKNQFSNLKLIGGISNLLPIAEFMVTTEKYPNTVEKNILTDKTFSDFLWIINNCLYGKYYKNIKDAEDSHFFSLISLFLEKIPEDLFTEYVIGSLKTISTSLINREHFNLLRKEFHTNILLNEKILLKFNYEKLEDLWKHIHSIYLSKSLSDIINIPKMCSILLFYDRERYVKFCCEFHKKNFVSEINTEVLKPDMEKRLIPLRKIITLIIEQNINNSNIIALYQLLTKDISPCMQALIINSFEQFYNESKYKKFKNSMIYKQESIKKIIHINLFVLSTSLYDIRILLVNFTLSLINQKCCDSNTCIKLTQNMELFIENNLIPLNIYIDQSYIKNEDKDKKNNITSIENKDVSNNNINNLTPESTNTPKQENEEQKSKEKEEENSNFKYKEKIYFLYNCYSYINQNNKVNISKFYDNDHFNRHNHKLFPLLHEKLINNISYSLTINCLIKLCVYGDIKLSDKFLGTLYEQAEKGNKFALEEFKNNNKLLNWLIELSFQVYLVINIPEYIPGFVINGEEKINSEENKEILNHILNLSKKLIIYIFKNNIYKFDFFLTWGNYYLRLFDSGRQYYDFVLLFIKEIITSLFDEKFSNIDDKILTSNNKEYLNYLYFYSLLFEFITFFKHLDIFETDKYKLLYNDENEKSIKLPYYFNGNIFFDIETTEIFLDKKWSYYSLGVKLFNNIKNLWSNKFGEEKNAMKLFEKYVKKIDPKNKFSNVLIFLISSKEVNGPENIPTTMNTGIPLMKIIFDLLCLFINQSEDKNELISWIDELDNYIIFLIISTTSYTIPRKNYIELVDYNSIQNTVKDIIFFTICLLVDEIKKRKNVNIQEKLNFVFNKILFLCAKIYDDYKEKIENSKNVNIFNFYFFGGINKEDIETKSVYKLFTEFINNNNNNNNENVNEKNTNQSAFPIDDILKDINTKSLEQTLNFIQNNDNFRKYFYENENYKDKITENLFKFEKICQNRLQNISNIIPLYNNEEIIKNNKINYIPIKEREIAVSNCYVQECLFEDQLLREIKEISEEFNLKLDIFSIENEFNYFRKIRKYQKIKKELFSFTHMWSCEKLFYGTNDNEDNKLLKYKVVNILTQEFSKILLTPILDLKNYLPKFSDFDPETKLFYDNKFLKNVVDLNIEDQDKCYNIETNEKINTETKGKNDNDNDKEENINKFHILYEINHQCFNFLTINSTTFSNSKYPAKRKFIQFLKNLIKENKSENIKECCLLKQPYHIKGFFFISNKCIGFISFNVDISQDEEHYDKERHSCMGSIFKHQKDSLKHYYKEIPYNEIESVIKRKYFYRKNCIEIFTTNKKSYLFRYNNQNICDDIYLLIKEHFSYTENISISNSFFDNKIGFANSKGTILSNSNTPNHFLNLHDTYKKWINWEISNFELLMYLNIYSNRSYNDLTQYPIFPWHISDYVSESLDLNNQNTYRDFKIPIGMMEYNEDSKSRKDSYISHYETMEEDILEKRETPDKQPYCFGSHYSNSIYVTHYLVRVFPFSFMKIELQGNTFDDPNRLFNNLPESFAFAMTQKCDVREIIPEFFVFPEMYFNNNQFNLGMIKFDGSDKLQKVQNIILPPWCHNDPYILVSMFRKIFEGNKVSENLHYWIDIIFGRKQKSKEIYNIFYNESYEEFEKTFDKMNLEDKLFSMKMAEFGLCPIKLFLFEPGKKYQYEKLGRNKNLDDSKSEIVIEKCKDKLKYIPKNIRLFKIKNENIIITLTSNEVDKYTIEYTKRKEKKENDIPVIDYNIKFNSQNKCFISKHRSSGSINPSNRYIAIYDSGNCVASAGLFNGEILVTTYGAKNGPSGKLYVNSDYSMISNLIIDDTDNFSFCGTISGIVYVYHIDTVDRTLWIMHKKLYDHKNEITDICVSNKLNIFCTCARDGFIFVYTYPKCSLKNSFKFDNSLFADCISISSCPLPCFVIYVKKTKKILVYSINWHFIKNVQLDNELNAFKIYHNYKFEDHIIYSLKNSSEIKILSLPDMEIVNKINDEGEILSIDVSNDNSIAVLLM